jgi:hypothetical protein
MVSGKVRQRVTGRGWWWCFFQTDWGGRGEGKQIIKRRCWREADILMLV